MPRPVDWSELGPADLQRIPRLLLHKSAGMHFYSCCTFLMCFIAHVERGPFDGKYGQILDHGQHFMYTLDANYLPSPPLQGCMLQLRRDCHFGQDDPVLWPQPFVRSYPHYAVIRRRPEDPNHELARWWWLPDRSHVEFLSSTIGLLCFDIVKSYSASIKQDQAATSFPLSILYLLRAIINNCSLWNPPYTISDYV